MEEEKDYINVLVLIGEFNSASFWKHKQWQTWLKLFQKRSIFQWHKECKHEVINYSLDQFILLLWKAIVILLFKFNCAIEKLWNNRFLTKTKWSC
jgi:hypothetical protein